MDGLQRSMDFVLSGLKRQPRGVFETKSLTGESNRVESQLRYPRLPLVSDILKLFRDAESVWSFDQGSPPPLV